MANSSPGLHKENVSRIGIGDKLWKLVCCNSSSTISPVETAPTSIELTDSSQQTQPGKDSVSGKADYDDVIDTVDSIVDFVLKGVQAIGSNLPGIGAVSVVLSAKDKFMTDRENRRDSDRILKYIEDLCEDARLVDGVTAPDIDMDNARFIEILQRDFAIQKKSKGWRHALDIINADARKEDLGAVWKGIERAMERHGLKVNVNSARVIENVFRKLVEVNETVNDIRAVQEIQVTKDEEKAMDDLLNRLELSTAKGARFDSGRTEQTRLVSCTADTRVEVLDTIERWATGAIGCEHLFWLNGLAGTGKSTIATTIAKWAQEREILGASFFFSRNVVHLNSTARVFPTLAYQLALFDEQYKRELCNILRTAGDVVSANLEIQFDVLIRKPFAACREERSILVMLDALDECSPEEDVKQMLRLLLQYDEVEPGRTKLRIFITSRPESHIRLVFTSRDGTNRHEKVVLHDIDKDTVRKDIKKYLTEEFEKMCSGDFERKPPKDWPSSSEFEKLLNNCGEFFLYAATVVRFIGDGGIGDPVSQLAEILGLMENPSMTVSTNAYHTLDSLYLAVLEQAARKDPREGSVARIVHIIATVVCLIRRMSVQELALFLGMTPDDVRYTLRHLHSVILVPDVVSVQLFHQSFTDFLKDPKRCPPNKGFLVDVAVHERSMASRCMDLNSLAGVERYGPVLSYAVEHWMSHFQSGNPQDTGGPSEKGSLWPVITGEELSEEIVRLERAEFGKPWSESSRRGILDAVQDWLTGRDEKQSTLLWLYGWADRGHPSIGMYLARWVRNAGIPGACVSSDLIPYLGMDFALPFLASQLARLDPDYQRELYNIIQSDTEILVSGNYRMQFEALIRQPFSLLAREKTTQPILLILDAYDEGLPALVRSKLPFLLWLLSAPTFSGPKLRVLVVCKPESVYRALLDPQSSQSQIASYEFDEHMDRDDIRTFIERWLQGREEILPIESFEKLLDFCGTSLTFARTAIRFIFDREVGDPNGQLRELCTSADSTYPRFEVDDLYRLILRRIGTNRQDEDIERIRCLIATNCCFRRTEYDVLSIDLLAYFLSEDENNIHAMLQQLNCFDCMVDDNDIDSLGRFHLSFEEFIQDKDRCTDSRFLVDMPAHERFMALRCCSNVRNNEGSLTYNKHPYRYSIAHWPSHLRSAIYHDLGVTLMEEPELTMVLNDKVIIAESYDSQGKTIRITLGDDIDIIRFVRELVEKYQPKNAETILALLRNAEADEDVVESRERYLSERKRLLGDDASQIHSGGDGDS